MSNSDEMFQLQDNVTSLPVISPKNVTKIKEKMNTLVNFIGRILKNYH